MKAARSEIARLAHMRLVATMDSLGGSFQTGGTKGISPGITGW